VRSTASREIREIARVLLERLELALGVLVGHPVRAADLRERSEQLVVRQTVPVEDRLHVAIRLGRSQDQMLDRDVVVLEALRLVLGFLEELKSASTERRLRTAGHLGNGFQSFLEFPADRPGARPGTLDQWSRDPLALLEQRDQQVLRQDFRVASPHGAVHRVAHRLLALRGQSIHTHHSTSSRVRRRHRRLFRAGNRTIDGFLPGVSRKLSRGCLRSSPFPDQHKPRPSEPGASYQGHVPNFRSSLAGQRLSGLGPRKTT
jgi:hypothetical protein